MTISRLHNELTEKFTKRFASTHFTNTGLEVNICIIEDKLTLLYEIKEFVEKLGFSSKITGRKYKKLEILK